jgi:hypothetical protein
MEGTDYLIHPVDLSIRERGVKSRYGSSSVNDLSFTISNYGEFEITGFFLQNLKFQIPILFKTNNRKPFDSNSHLFKVGCKKTNNQIMVYTMVDMDTNKDGKLDTSDIKALYLSKISGENSLKYHLIFRN